MKKILIYIIMFCAVNILYAQNYDRNVLIEVFTNSHCPQCPPAHAALDSYLANGSAKDKVNYIFYHMVFPYPSDALYQANTSDPAGRNNYYGPFFSTPVGFVDGINTGYSSWAGKIDAAVGVKTSVQIILSGTIENGAIKVKADVNLSSAISGNNVIHFVVVEDVNYQGNNGISFHKHVMRKMVTSPTGETIDLSSNHIIEKTIDISSSWIPENIGIVAFIQNSATKEIYQSEFITYSELGVTGVEEANNSITDLYNLSQNYPNPFNPSTIIEYEIPKEEYVVLKVYNLTGEEVSELVNSKKSAGKYIVNFTAENLSSGIYYYTLSAGEYYQTRKFVLLK